MAILDQRSFLNERVGTKVFGENINIWDDVTHPLQSGSTYDGEGAPRQRLQLVENGVVKRLTYARATAAKMQSSEHKDKVGPIAPTGHDRWIFDATITITASDGSQFSSTTPGIILDQDNRTFTGIFSP